MLYASGVNWSKDVVSSAQFQGKIIVKYRHLLINAEAHVCYFCMQR